MEGENVNIQHVSKMHAVRYIKWNPNGRHKYYPLMICVTS